MLLPSKKLSEDQRKILVNYVYDGVGCAMDVCKQLPCGLPEYIYQEAFARVLASRDIVSHKEYVFHPVFDGRPLDSFMRMDFVIERAEGNIIVEAKAIEQLTKKERSQLFGYMVGTGFPYGLLVNFSAYPKPMIERYYFDSRDMTMTAF